MAVTKLINLSVALLDFLKKAGYTHFQLRGISPVPGAQNRDYNMDNYILVPWNESLGYFQESDWAMEPIDSNEVTDMLDVEFGILFKVQLPEAVALTFLNGG